MGAALRPGKKRGVEPAALEGIGRAGEQQAAHALGVARRGRESDQAAERRPPDHRTGGARAVDRRNDLVGIDAPVELSFGRVVAPVAAGIEGGDAEPRRDRGGDLLVVESNSSRDPGKLDHERSVLAVKGHPHPNLSGIMPKTRCPTREGTPSGSCSSSHATGGTSARQRASSRTSDSDGWTSWLPGRGPTTKTRSGGRSTRPTSWRARGPIRLSTRPWTARRRSSGRRAGWASTASPTTVWTRWPRSSPASRLAARSPWSSDARITV